MSRLAISTKWPLLSGRPSMGSVRIGHVQPTEELSAAMLREASGAYEPRTYSAPLKLEGASDDAMAFGRVSRLQWLSAVGGVVVWVNELDTALQGGFLSSRYELAKARFYWPKSGGGDGCRLFQVSFQEAPTRAAR